VTVVVYMQGVRLMCTLLIKWTRRGSTAMDLALIRRECGRVSQPCLQLMPRRLELLHWRL